MNPSLAVIQALVAPAVMISASCLFCLALYNRLAAIVSRARTFNKERYDLQVQLVTVSASTPEQPQLQEKRRRLETLDVQLEQILNRARHVRAALYCLMTTILTMLGCSLFLGIGQILGLAAFAFWGSLALFVAGIWSMGMATVFAIYELQRALDPVALEYKAQDAFEQESAI